MKKDVKVSYFDVILFGIIFNFLQLALVHDLSAVFRYPVFGILLLIFIANIKKNELPFNVYVCALVLIGVLVFVNVYHFDSFSMLGAALLIVPLFVIVFSANVDIANDENFYLKLLIGHLVIFLFSLYKYRFLLAGADYILNENEVACYSFIITSLLYFVVHLKGRVNKFFLSMHTLLSLFIATIMEARAIQFSIIVLPLAFWLINYRSRIHKVAFNILMYLIIAVPILMVIYISKLIDLYADLVEQQFGLPAEAIKSELERFDMFSYIRDKLSKSFWGAGIGNTDYMKDIEISGLHSGSLDLLYWGGYTLFIVFNLFFFSIVRYVLKLRPQAMFCCFIVLYYLLLQNYYEGLLFGNMGILLMILSMCTTLIIRSKKNEYPINV